MNAVAQPQKLLVCPPAFLSVSRPFSNPWEERAWNHLGTDPYSVIVSCAKDTLDEAFNAWLSKILYLRNLQVEITYLTPFPQLSDQTFTKDLGLACRIGERKIFIPARFRVTKRQPEITEALPVICGMGYEIHALPSHDRDMEPIYFEGGDARWWHDTLIIGHGQRTNKCGAEFVRSTLCSLGLGAEILLVELSDSWFYHLDLCFCWAGPATFIAPSAFTEKSVHVFRRHNSFIGTQIVEVGDEDAAGFLCGSRVVRRGNNWNVIANDRGEYGIRNRLPSGRIRDFLKMHCVNLIPINFSSFIPSGAGPECCGLII